MRTMKRVLIALAVFGSGFLIGCTSSESVASESVTSDLQKFDMEYVGADLVNGVGDFYLYKDKETGVEYLVFKTTDGVGICPRYEDWNSVYIER